MIAAFSQFIGRSFALWTLCFAIAGFFLPQLFIGFKSYISLTLGIIMFGMGLTLSKQDFSEVFKRPRQVFIGILGQFIIMPSLALMLTLIFPLPPEIVIGVLLVGCCPGGTASNVITFLSKGDVALSVTITSMTTLMAPVVTPLLLKALAGQMIPVAFLGMMMSIVQIVLLPIVAGLVVRTLLGANIRQITPILPIVSVTGIVLIVATVVALNQVKIREVGLLVALVVILHNVLGYAIGYLLAHFTGMSMAQRKAVAIEVGMQNSGLGATLAGLHFSPLAAVPSALFSVWHNISGALLANFFQRLRNDPHAPQDSEITSPQKAKT